MDLLVEDLVVVEVKAVAVQLPVHEAQVTSYVRLAGKPLGYLLNFHTELLREGIMMVVNSSRPSPHRAVALRREAT